MDNPVLDTPSTSPAARARGKRKAADSAPELPVITFPLGLVGCPTWQRFQLAPQPFTQFGQLICLDEPGVELFVADPVLLHIAFSFELDDDDVEALRLDDADDARVVCILSLHRDPPGVTANLAGPLVVHWRERIGRQVVLDHAAYPLRFPVLSGEAAQQFIETALSSTDEARAQVAAAPSQPPATGEGA